jgi:type I restriction enzyme S subunit
MSEADVQAIEAAFKTAKDPDGDDGVNVRIVPLPEIESNDYDLSIGRYIKRAAAEIADVPSALAAYKLSSEAFRTAEADLLAEMEADTLVGAAQNTTERGRRLRRTLLETVLAGDQASDWPRVLVGDIAVLEYGRALQESKRKGGKYPVYGSAGQVGNHEEALTPAGVTIVGRKGTAGRVSWSEVAVWPIDTTYWVRILSGTVDAHYLHLALDQAHLASLSQQTGVPGLNRELVYALMIPLPPLPLQQTIVRLFQKMDATIRAAEKELLKSQSLRAALLEDLLTGRHRLVDSGR